MTIKSNYKTINKKTGSKIRYYWMEHFTEKDGENPLYYITEIVSNDVHNVKLWSRFNDICRTIQYTNYGKIEYNRYIELVEFLEMHKKSLLNLKRYVSENSYFVNIQILKVFFKLLKEENIQNINSKLNKNQDIYGLEKRLIEGNNLSIKDLDQLLFIADVVGHVISKSTSEILFELQNSLSQ